MVFQIRTYSVLIVSAAEKFNQSIRTLLPVNDFYPVEIVGNVQEARRKLLEKEYDLVIINTPLPDEFGTKFAIDVCADHNAGVLLLVKSEVYESVNDKVMEHGVAVVAKPAPAQMVAQSI
ncbi:MAG: antitermination regulator, partial [Parasporobacterium sp.]|nr:antitermination regulator [Parasporobacterium sp.]